MQKNNIYLLAATHKTLRTVKQNAAQTMTHNQKLLTISNTIGKQPNNTKPEFFRVLFVAFVKNNRSANRRSQRVKFWINSEYKHLIYHPERPNEKKEDSFFESFRNFLSNLQDNSRF